MNIRNILAAGLVGLMVASCADNTCHIEGVVESAQAGDTLLFARMENDTFVPTDTVILEEGGKFSMDKPCAPTVIASYFFFNKQSQEAYSNVFFIEKGKVSMRIGTDGNVSGTENNDLYQALTDSIYELHKQMNAIYNVQPKDSMGMPHPEPNAESQLIALEQQASRLLEENVRKHIGKPLGYFLLLSCYDMFEPKDILELAEKNPLAKLYGKDFVDCFGIALDFRRIFKKTAVLRPFVPRFAAEFSLISGKKRIRLEPTGVFAAETFNRLAVIENPLRRTRCTPGESRFAKQGGYGGVNCAVIAKIPRQPAQRRPHSPAARSCSNRKPCGRHNSP